MRGHGEMPFWEICYCAHISLVKIKYAQRNIHLYQLNSFSVNKSYESLFEVLGLLFYYIIDLKIAREKPKPFMEL